MNSEKTLRTISEEVCACRKCPRLVKYREKVAREKRRAYREWTYWGRPLPGFGDARAELFILGLAPAAHGGNRTGRVFTGDRSGDFLYKALFEVGFANQPTSARRGDGLKLKGAYVAAAVRCAPPANKPLPSEILHCREYLERELEALRPRAVLALGKIAWDAYLESAVKFVIALTAIATSARDVILSGRLASVESVRDELSTRLAAARIGLTVRRSTGFATVAKTAAQGAALVADGLVGGRASALVDALGIREASGTVLDHLYVVDSAAARARLGIV